MSSVGTMVLSFFLKYLTRKLLHCNSDVSLHKVKAVFDILDKRNNTLDTETDDLEIRHQEAKNKWHIQICPTT